MTDKLKQAIEALSPVETIACPVPSSATLPDAFEKGAPLTPAQVRKMQEALAALRSIEPQRTVSREAIEKALRIGHSKYYEESELDSDRSVYSYQVDAIHALQLPAPARFDGDVTEAERAPIQRIVYAHKLDTLADMEAMINELVLLFRASHHPVQSVPGVVELAQKLVSQFGTEEVGWDRMSAIVVNPLELAKAVQDILKRKEPWVGQTAKNTGKDGLAG